MSCRRIFSKCVSTGRIIGMAVSLVVSACAPEPTTPADTDIAGVWKSNAHLFALSQIELNLIQEPRGIVSGGWSAKSDGNSGGCSTPCDASGLLIGRNSVAQVELELLGAGKFEGTLIDPNRLRGILAVGLGYDTITFVK